MSVCFITLHISYSTTLPRYSLIHCISAHINISIHIYISTLGPYINWFITSHIQKSTFLASTTNILFIPPDSSHYNTSSSPLAPFSLNKRNHVPVLLNKTLFTTVIPGIHSHPSQIIIQLLAATNSLTFVHHRKQQHSNSHSSTLIF